MNWKKWVGVVLIVIGILHIVGVLDAQWALGLLIAGVGVLAI